MRLKKPMIAVSAAGLLALAACGGSSGGNNPGGGGGSNPATDTGNFNSTGAGQAGAGKDPTATGPAAPMPGAKSGGTIYAEQAGAITTLDPTEAYYVDSASILQNLVTRSLTQYEYDPSTKSMVLVPDLATDLGRPNKNFTSWTFTLKKGIKFENGQAVTPQDIKYGIERSFDRSTFPGGANYSNQYFLDGATYKGPYKSGTKYNGVVIHGMNITIKMAKPFPDMPYWGAFPAMGPIPPGHASDPATYKKHPWSTGPYKFGNYVPGKSLTLVKNPYWKASTDPGRHQYVNEWDFSWGQDSSKIDATILQDQGQGQFTFTYDNVLAPDYPKFQQQAANRLVTGPNPCTFMWYPDNRKITNVNVRRALAWAYPYKASWLAGGSIEGVTRIPAWNVMPPGIPGRTQYNPLPGHTPGSTDPAKAKALLKQANALNYKITFPYDTDVPTSVAVKNQIVLALKKAGFNPQPYATTSSNYATLIANPNAPINVRSVGWCSDWPSGSSWIPPEFQSTGLPKSQNLGTNYEAYSSKYVDNQINKIQTLPIKQQPAAWTALEKHIMLKDFPVILTGYGADVMAHGSKVHGMYNDSTLGMPTLRDMWVG